MRVRVVVTGYGMVTPLGPNREETFQRANRGESGIDYIRSFDTRGFPCQIAGEVDDSKLGELADISLGKLDKFASRGLRLMLIATREAARQARLDEIPNRTEIGVSLGSHGQNPTVEEILFLHRFYNGEGQWDIKDLLQTGGYSYLQFFRRKPDVAPAILAHVFDCQGSNLSIVSACAAGAQAIGEAFHLIRAGRAKAMIAGGCEATVDFVGLAGFVLIQALAERYSSPPKASRPFDRKRSGFVLSEGAGALVLEEFGHAQSRGATVLGEILGYGASADAYRITDTHPKGEGALLAMEASLQDASLTPADVDYINAHGTSTLQNDATETLAIKKLFGERAKSIPVSSNKSMLGHTIAAAGAIESILTLVGLQRSIILPTINYEFPDPKCDLDYVPNVARSQEHQVALSNSFGFGGQNGCLCLGRFIG
ncbi:MAG TPA: beta-ketoacyl-[acyl-carrier-protein] synthase family protein [Candidatus Binatia bacterium]|jgi:3-oxoacyl-[acyl-carrier-protein] synthase II|nr:beta-ketoacyl-[acyl-carrier-protein] synthase family protein [Candidatus Binatia bacterium]